jgi:hypothetical protein
MLGVENKPFMLNVFMLSVLAPEIFAIMQLTMTSDIELNFQK